MALDRKNILITGGAGFIGSHLAEALVEENNVICIDNFITSQVENIQSLLQHPNFEFIKHDLTQAVNLNDYPELNLFKVKALGIQEIYHLACPTSPKHFNKYPIETILANSHATKNVLDLALQHKAKILLASTAAVYGNYQGNSAIREDYWGEVNPLGPRSAYDEGKRFAESLFANYHNVYQLDTKIIRLFKTFGPRMRLDDGRMVPDFIVSALNGKPLQIYGDEYLSATFTYIDDVVEALIRMMNANTPGPVNVGSDHAHRVADIAQRIIELTDSTSEVVFLDPLPYPGEHGVPDITRAKETLGWFPLISIEDGLKKSIDYMKAHYRLYGINVDQRN